MAKANGASLTHIRKHWRVLCERIGNRLSGGEGEQRAADYIEGQFNRFGMKNISQQAFEFPNFEAPQCTLRVGPVRGSKKKIGTVTPFMYSVSTPSGGIRGRLVYLEGAREWNFEPDVRGKVGLLIGSLSLADKQLARRLTKSGLAALIAVDARVPFDWTTPIGAAPQWVHGYTLPSVGVPYLEAVRLLGRLPLEVEIHLDSRAFPAMSQNVIGEVVGTSRPDQVIVVSGHHDCVSGNVGADDNASGVIFTLELARLFAKRRPKRTIRFISYGVEEKLSVGAYVYMRSLSTAAQRQCVLSINADAITSRAGEDMLAVTGPRPLYSMVRRHWDRRRHPANILRRVDVFSNQFPLNICGIPSIRLVRPNMLGHTFWTLHSVHDNLDNVDPQVMARTVDTTAGLLDKIATADRMPFSRKIPQDQMEEVDFNARHVYRHPCSIEKFDYRPYVLSSNRPIVLSTRLDCTSTPCLEGQNDSLISMQLMGVRQWRAPESIANRIANGPTQHRPLPKNAAVSNAFTVADIFAAGRK